MLPRSVLAVCVVLAPAAPSSAQTCDDFPDGFHRTGPGGAPRAFAVFDDGSGATVYAGGGAFSLPGSANANALLKWEGQRWVVAHDFGTLSASVEALVVHDDGSGPALYVGGSALLVGGAGLSGLARFDGTTLTNVGLGVQGTVRALAVYDAGAGPELYVGGTFVSASGVLAPRITRWNGSTFATIGGVLGSGSVSVEDLLVHDDGSGPRLVVPGTFSIVAGSLAANVATFGPGGWSTMASGIDGTVRDLASHDFGAGPVLIAGGAFATAGGVPAANVAAWNGSAWSALGAGLPSNTNDLVVHDDGQGARLFAALQSQNAVWVSASDGSSWQPLSSQAPDSTVFAFLVHDFGAGVRLYAGGGFDAFGSLYAPRFAGWDGSQWFAPEPADGLGAITPGRGVFAQRAFQGSLYVAGAFQGAGSSVTGSIARYDGAMLHELPGIGGSTSSFRALEVFDDGNGEALYAAGAFSTVDGIAAIRGIARWNGTSWSSLAEQPGIGTTPWAIVALCVFDDGSGAALYAAGRITSDLPGLRGVARWRDGVWSAVGGGFDAVSDPAARALAVFDDGAGAALYVAGHRLDFGSFVDAIARWDGSAWTQVGGAPALGDTSYAYALSTYDDGDGNALIVGGNFTAIGGVAAADLARWRNGAWDAVGNGLDDPSAGVFALATHDDGRGSGEALFVGGYFPTQGGAVANGLARWDGTSWSTLAGGARRGDGSCAAVSTLASATIGGRRDLFVGGDFEYAGSGLATLFARWPGCGETGETLCFGDGSGTACPCGNASAVGARAGCLHSLGAAGTLRGAGESSLSNDTLRLDGSAMPDTSVLYFQATSVVNGGAGAVFGDGLRCGGGAVLRIGTKANSAGSSSYPAPGDAAVSVRGAVGAPTTRIYQGRFRNSASFCTSEVFNFTNALRITWEM